MNYKYIPYFSNFEKFKSFVKTFTPNKQTLIFKEQLCMSTKDFIFETDQAQIFSVPDSSRSYTVKMGLAIFPSPAGMSLTKPSLRE